jgi:hypothetical protein
MKTQPNFSIDKFLSFPVISLLLFGFAVRTLAVNDFPPVKSSESDNFIEYKGKIVDKKTGSSLAYAGLTVVGTNISSISNSEGDFSIKISKGISNPKIKVSFIGYKNKLVTLTDLKPDKPRIELEPMAVELPELNVISKDAEVLIRAVLEKRGDNYFNTQTLMTAFYRETIKKSRTYVSLAEAVVEVNKQPYTSFKPDAVKLYKSRKKTDYNKLDTLAFKLQGGPFNSLYLDIMKNPDYIFTDDMIMNYEFTFDYSTHEDNRLIYVLDFKQNPNKKEPMYYGKLYIDAQSLALKSAVFSLNITDKEAAAEMFIKKKPFNARVYPIDTKYRIDYLEKDGKWYYAYSRIELGMKIIWKKKLFNTNYYSTVEMAITDWGKGAENKAFDYKDRLKPSVIISDEASGFSDPKFWGEFNVIEPEKSIDSAIKKIQKQLEKK